MRSGDTTPDGGGTPHAAMGDTGADLLAGTIIPPPTHTDIWAAVYTVFPEPPHLVLPIQSLLKVFAECPQRELPDTVAAHLLNSLHAPSSGDFVLLPRLNAHEETARRKSLRTLVKLLGKIVAAAFVGTPEPDRDTVGATVLCAVSRLLEHLETTVCCMTPGVVPHGPVDETRVPGIGWVADTVDAVVRAATADNPRFPDAWVQKATADLGSAVAQAAWALSLFSNRFRRELDAR